MKLLELQEKYKISHQLIIKHAYEDAKEIIYQVLSINPDDISFLLLKSEVLIAEENYKLAEEALNKIIGLDNKNFYAHYQLGKLFSILNNLYLSHTHYAKAFQLNPTPNNHFAFIEAKRKIARTGLECNEVISLFNQFLDKKPNAYTVYFYRSLLYKRIGKYEFALDDLNRFLQIFPSHFSAIVLKSQILLLQGDFEKGFELYEKRLNLNDKTFKTTVNLPIWKGENIADEKLFVFAEQGFGDNIHFIRYAIMAKEKGLNIVVGNLVPLRPLLKYNLKKLGIPVIQNSIVDNDAKYQVSMMSLPYYLGASLENIPLTKAYIQAEPEFNQKWKIKIPKTKRLKVGIVWQGSFTNGRDKERSIPLQILSPLFQLEIEFHCLQKIISEQDLEFVKNQPNFTAWDTEIDNFSDTAGLIKQMDLIISVDTSVAHLAGAMGKPTWILITFDPDFRWLLNRNDSVWYESVRLFRQSNDLQWQPVISEVYTELTAIL